MVHGVRTSIKGPYSNYLVEINQMLNNVPKNLIVDVQYFIIDVRKVLASCFQIFHPSC